MRRCQVDVEADDPLGQRQSILGIRFKGLTMAYWIFQSNPKLYRVLEAIRDFERLPWLASQRPDQIFPGDGVLMWLSGQDAGIYAIAEVLEKPRQWKELPSIGYWIDPSQFAERPYCLIRFTTKMLHKPLLRSVLREDPILSELSILKMAQGTNFPVTPEQWRRVFEIKGV